MIYLFSSKTVNAIVKIEKYQAKSGCTVHTGWHVIKLFAVFQFYASRSIILPDDIAFF